MRRWLAARDDARPALEQFHATLQALAGQFKLFNRERNLFNVVGITGQARRPASDAHDEMLASVWELGWVNV